MALDPKQIAELLKLRALGFSQAEIAETLNTSQQVIAYQLRKLKKKAKETSADDVFNAALIGGLGGAAAGVHAGEWVKNRKFANAQTAQDAEEAALADHSAVSELSDEGVVRIGHVVTKVRDTVQSALGYSRDAIGLESAAVSLEAASILAESIHVDQSSLIANSNIVEIARAQASARLALASTQAALARKESRGCHHRTDFTDSDEEHLTHYTVDQHGEVNTLALRKSKTGNWILPPQ